MDPLYYVRSLLIIYVAVVPVLSDGEFFGGGYSGSVVFITVVFNRNRFCIMCQRIRPQQDSHTAWVPVLTLPFLSFL